MVYTLLRDRNVYSHLQVRILKRFIEKQTAKLREINEYDLDTVTELLSALKELTELSSQDKLSFL
jgi:hypothetical protein